MGMRAIAFDKAACDRSFRSFAVFAAAFLFLLAQTLFAAHASTSVEDLQGHSAAECAVCLAGGVADDPAKALPSVREPLAVSEAVKTAIPAALMTEIAVRAASPRAPPSY